MIPSLPHAPRRRRGFVLMLVVGALAVVTLVVTSSTNRALHVDATQRSLRERHLLRERLHTAAAMATRDAGVFLSTWDQRTTLEVDGAPVAVVVQQMASPVRVLERPDTLQRLLTVSVPMGSPGEDAPVMSLTRSYVVLLRPGLPATLMLLEEAPRRTAPPAAG